ncbi:tellurite resistance protein [Massilia sp. Root351]|jgi:tellurite resistance-related uncharacterized protein|uniref:DUF1971 domain-containing protein n=1 Tax=Massilia sp. Root351 TaxID=1736522 RepID=UPI00070AA0F4|nr:DUF1971 domain-containing protein [Massilia sp. Root351]KQV80608.1 tellurite resistance protein [Massilia sp. Root351]
MKTLPDNVAFYKSSADFTEHTVPAALQRNHSTAAGVWGRIAVLEGALLYHISGPEKETVRLTPEQPGVVEPRILHEVEIIGPVRFRVDFHR